MEGSPALEVVEAPLDPEDAIRASEPRPDALPVLPGGKVDRRGVAAGFVDGTIGE